MRQRAEAASRAVRWQRIARHTIERIAEEHCLGLAAQLAYFLLLAIFPALLCLVALVGYFPVQDALTELLLIIRPVAPRTLVAFLADQLGAIAGDGRAGLATAGIAGALWSSSAAMVAIIETLNRTCRVAEWRPWWKRRIVAVALTVAFGLFTTVSLLLILVGPEIARGVAGQLSLQGVVTPLWQLVRWPAMIALVAVALDLVHHFAPNRVQPWSWFTPGALVATGLWIVSSFGFKLIRVPYGNIQRYIRRHRWGHRGAPLAVCVEPGDSGRRGAQHRDRRAPERAVTQDS